MVVGVAIAFRGAVAHYLGLLAAALDRVFPAEGYDEFHGRLQDWAAEIRQNRDRGETSRKDAAGCILFAAENRCIVQIYAGIARRQFGGIADGYAEQRLSLVDMNEP